MENEAFVFRLDQAPVARAAHRLPCPFAGPEHASASCFGPDCTHVSRFLCWATLTHTRSLARSRSHLNPARDWLAAISTSPNEPAVLSFLRHAIRCRRLRSCGCWLPVSRVRFPACVSFAASVNWSKEYSVIDSAPFRRHQSLVLVLTLSFWIFKSHLIAPLGANHHHFVSDPIKACQLSRAHLQLGWPTRRVTPLRTK
ncbi:hypothetical protein CEP51_007313 [Fusarium floridanum]|uniref:Uncharacterized protein n=1 Tax=Fusarium floridanum TaxID=1325733 RepID=A0A428RPJ1_9HYPO|nr:hypothetical protein CEP51_007313 [Fusarium floridanum]